ncbi:chitobiase/beta-hexosaminidase C-terminal domain-containing protein, partial [candidate division KSB1 bacterium]|nr:chitobiase/beta-hexosaminidase C-terminal domain-containing protein [candidate division KSB1 bacterium]
MHPVLQKWTLFSSLLLLSTICIGQGEDYAETLMFSHQRGFYTDNFDLTLSTTTPGLLIKYTQDGTDPLTSGSAASGASPLTIRIDPG